MSDIAAIINCDVLWLPQGEVVNRITRNAFFCFTDHNDGRFKRQEFFCKLLLWFISRHNHMVSWNHTWHSYVSFRFFTWNQPVLEINLTWNQPLLKSTCVDMNRKWDWPETFKHFSSFNFDNWAGRSNQNIRL